MVVGALGLLFARKAVHAALCMALVMVNLGVFYLASQAEFLGIVQVFVYTGAVMMLFLFVLMLVGVDSSDSLVRDDQGAPWAALVLALGLGGPAVPRGRAHHRRRQAGLDAANALPGNVSAGRAHLRQVRLGLRDHQRAADHRRRGAMVLAHRERVGPKADQRELAPSGSSNNEYVAGLPGPGCLRPAQRRRHPRAAAGRHAERAVGQPHAHRARPDRRPDATPTDAGQLAEIEEGRSRDEPDELHLPRDRSCSRSGRPPCSRGATRSSSSWASS
jgi:NADH-quinone oxidoreductase subunit J